MKRQPPIPAECISCMDRLVGSFPLSIVIVYNDITAALRAAEMVERLGRQCGGKLQPQLKPVRLDTLSDANSYDQAFAESAEASMIIVSVNGGSELPATLKKWVKGCLDQKRHAEAAMVALLGSPEKMDATDSPRLQFLRRAAKAVGLDFFAPGAHGRVPELDDSYFEDTYFGGRSEAAGALSAG